MMRSLHLADFLTLANAACGVAAVFCTMIFLSTHASNYFFAAAWLAPAALVFDVLDGRVARWRQQQTTLGRELDSLADVISFGVAPATLGFAAGMDGGWDWVALIYFVCCGVSRLARFNVTAEMLSQGKDTVAYFEGHNLIPWNRDAQDSALCRSLLFTMGRTRPEWAVASESFASRPRDMNRR